MEAMQAIVDSSERAAEAVQGLIDKIAELDAALASLPDMKRVQIVVDTVGNVGDVGGAGLGGIAPEAQAAAEAVHELGIAWSEEAVAQKAADAAAQAFGRDVATAAAETEAFAIDRLHASMQNLEQDLYIQAHSADAADVAFERLRQGYQQVYAGIDPATQAMDSYRAALQAVNAEGLQNWEVSGGVISANRIIGRTVTDTAAAVDNANRGWAVNIGWMRLTATALHWIVAGSAEFLAVAVPAAIALGAGLAVAAQGAQNVQQHFSALYAATESTYSAMHQTVGSVLGLGSALQNAQNAANPGVYEILGSVINDAKASFMGLAGVGLQVVHMFDEFAARVTVDLKNGMGTQVQGLLSGMVTDLQEFGNVLGNLGHALLNFAAAMPGLAHVLLAVAVGISDVVEYASRFGSILTFGMALEELYRWGGLVLTLLVRLTGAMGAMNAMGATNFVTKFGAALLALSGRLAQGLTALGSWVSGLGNAEGILGRIGGALQTAGAEAAGFAESLSPGMVAAGVAAAAALTYVAYKLVTMKDATEQWIAASSAAVAKATDLNVLPTIYTQLADTLTRASAAQQKFSSDSQHLSQNVVFAGRAGMIMSDSMRNSGTAADQLSQHMLSLIATANTVRGNVNLLAGVFHTSAIGALALANAAGVNLQVGLTKGSVAAKIAEQQITNLKTGLGAMAAPAGLIGADMQAVGIQSQLAASKVGTVNQAMDAFIAGTTGGMTTVMQFNAALTTMGKDGLSSSVTITGAINSISRDAARMGYTLQGIGPKAQQSWQQFGAAVQQGNSVLDTFRVGMAENLVSWPQFANEVKAVGGALLPFAAHSKTALGIVSQLAQEMGLPASTSLKTLAADFGITGKAAQNAATGGMERLVAKMANMSVVARNLSATVSGQLDSAMAGAIVKASGLDQAYSKWATDAMHNAAPKTVAGDLNTINRITAEVNTTMGKATKVLNDNATAGTALGGALKGAAAGEGNLGSVASKTHDALVAHAIAAKTAALTTQGFSQQAHSAATTAQGLSTNAQRASTQVKALGTSASVTRGYLGDVNNEIRTTATAASGAQGPLGTMNNEIRTLGGVASTAAGQVHGLASAMAGLQSKTVTLTVNTVDTTTNIVKHAAGTMSAAAGLALVGEQGPELVQLAGGERIYPAGETARLIGTPQGAAAAQTGGFGNQGSANLHSNIVVNLDGKQIWQAMQTQTLKYNTRNSGSRTGKLVPGP